jgi:hypothetical protein
MDDYQFRTAGAGGALLIGVIRASDGAQIPISDLNRDCVSFVVDWKNGASVKNADGSSASYSDAAVMAIGLTPPQG